MRLALRALYTHHHPPESADGCYFVFFLLCYLPGAFVGVVFYLTKGEKKTERKTSPTKLVICIPAGCEVES